MAAPARGGPPTPADAVLPRSPVEQSHIHVERQAYHLDRRQQYQRRRQLQGFPCLLGTGLEKEGRVSHSRFRPPVSSPPLGVRQSLTLDAEVASAVRGHRPRYQLLCRAHDRVRRHPAAPNGRGLHLRGPFQHHLAHPPWDHLRPHLGLHEGARFRPFWVARPPDARVGISLRRDGSSPDEHSRYSGAASRREGRDGAAGDAIDQAPLPLGEALQHGHQVATR